MMCTLTIAVDDTPFVEPEIRFFSVGAALIMPFISALHWRAAQLARVGSGTSQGR